MNNESKNQEEKKDRFAYDAVGYTNAVMWLKKVGKWEYVSTHGQSVDGLSIVQTANVLWEQENKPKP
jgi:hypothetical protein